MDIWSINAFAICILILISAVSGFNCSFDDETGCQWKQGNWTRTNISKDNKGPSGDHNTGSGHFIYANADTYRRIVNLTSKNITSGQYCASLWYFMVGENALSLKVITKASTSTTVFQAWGSQGPNWKEAKFDMSSNNTFKMVIAANFSKTGGDSYGYIGIDDIAISPGLCSLDCTFNDGFCVWKQYGKTTLKWSRKLYVDPAFNLTQSSLDGRDFYLNIYKGAKNNKTGNAILWSPLRPAGTNCLIFQVYLFSNTSFNSLSVVIKRKGIGDKQIWSQKNVPHTTLQKQFIDINNNTTSGVNYNIRFVGVVGSGKDGNILIDNIKQIDGQCKYGCESNPCVNGGTCMHGLRGNYSCACFKNWSGRICNESATTVSYSGGTRIPMVVYIITPVGIVTLVIIVVVVVFMWRRRKRKSGKKTNEDEEFKSDTDNETGVENDGYALTELFGGHHRQRDEDDQSGITNCHVSKPPEVNDVNYSLTEDFGNINDVAAQATFTASSNDESPLYAKVVKVNASAKVIDDMNGESSYDILGTAEQTNIGQARVVGDRDYDTFETAKYKCAGNPTTLDNKIDNNYYDHVGYTAVRKNNTLSTDGDYSTMTI